MKNLAELQDKYSRYFNGLGKIGWGGKSYYEINSDIPLNLNSAGGKNGFILNDSGQVELWDSKEHYNYTFFYKGQEITEDEYRKLEDEGASDDDLTLKSEDSKKWWGLTLDKYYPHPYYPTTKVISGFEIINNIPFFDEGEFYDLEDDKIRSIDDDMLYNRLQCLEYPEFFKPIYH